MNNKRVVWGFQLGAAKSAGGRAEISKILVDRLYGSKSCVFNYSAVINGCKCPLVLDLATLIRRQANEVVIV